ncbi:MAG: DUF362 domain-containing protein [Deltaproteobacteria bacterium]|nr:DUF362 domain-containing protein [Deltaproteobacteria bacterium]
MADAVDRLCAALQFKVSAGTRVLLKPNLLTGRSNEHLACTHPEFVAAAAEWFIEQGAVVSIGDSPAFGTARGVMRATGIEQALAGLPVGLIDFDHATPAMLAGGLKVKVARAALECDLLVNLPRIKAHSQFYMTLAVKNYFGTVMGFQKPAWHLRYGDKKGRFASYLVDLLAVLPPGITLIDGIIAMHTTGPVAGRPYSLGLLGGAINPVAADTALLQLLNLDLAKSAVWRECAKRGLAGSETDRLDYPLAKPAEFNADGFRTPGILKPESFNPIRIMVSACRRFAARLKESS